MGLFDDIRDKATSFMDSIANEAKKFANKGLLEGTCAACAMVAEANGEIKSEEKQKIIGHMGRNEALKVYGMSEVIEAFNKYLEHYEFDRMIGEGECLKAVGTLKDKPDEGNLLVRVCCAVGAADGDFDNKEKDCVRKICGVLNINPSDIGI